MSQVIDAADLRYRRAIRELKLATKACEAVTKRTNESIRLSKADTDARRARLDEDLRVQLMDEVRERHVEMGEWP